VPGLVIRLNQPMGNDMEEAKLYILKILRNGMALMSSPMVEEALTLAREYGITAEELIKKAQEQAYNV